MTSALSSKAQIVRGFDYSSLDAETSLFVQQQTGEIRAIMKRTAQDIIKVGQKLIEVKKKLGHGNFGTWLKAEFEWGMTTAWKFMRVAEVFGNYSQCEDLSIAPSALYVLAAPSTPETAKKEALARVKEGETISYTTAEALKRKHKQLLARNSQEQSREGEEFLQATTQLDTPFQKPQQRKIEPLPPEMEIVAYGSQEQEPRIPRIISLERWWQLGEQHLLYCGDFHSPQFQARLPERIALALCFPPVPNWHLGKITSKVNSFLTLFSHYRDVDLKLLRELVRNSLELYTEGEETVVFSYLPDPALLLLGHQLECRCLIAEPNTERCKAIIQAWMQTGGRVESEFEAPTA